MSTQSAKTPTPSENVALTLSPDEYDFLIRLLGDNSYSGQHIPTQIYQKLRFVTSNIGDACRHSAHIPEAPGQGGINDYCPECDDEGTIESFDSVIPCPYCSKGQSGNQ